MAFVWEILSCLAAELTEAFNEVQHYGNTFSKDACRNNPGFLTFYLDESDITQIQIDMASPHDIVTLFSPSKCILLPYFLLFFPRWKF